MNAIESAIGYKFNDLELLNTALTHSSYSHESADKDVLDNERLEFLGDAVLELVISDYLFNNYGHLAEGDLTQFRAALVCEAALAKAARKLKLGGELRLGKGEANSGGADRASILSDAFEAVIGAVYLDGKLECAREFIIKFLTDDIAGLVSSFKYADSKTHLQEIIQQDSTVPIVYTVVDEEGPAHNKKFTVQAIHGDKILGTGTGKTKKEAERNAADDAMRKNR